MIEVGYAELFRLLLPEIIVVAAALVVLVVDLVWMRAARLQARFAVGALISCIGCGGAIAQMLIAPRSVNVLDWAIVLDPQTQVIQIALLVLTMFVVLLSIGESFTEHVGEYLALILFATTSMMLLVSTQNVLLIFISLELLSLSLYILTAFRKRSKRAAEAALKYFVFGGVSAAFLLFGLSLIYGLTNSINLAGIATALQGPSLDPLLIVAMVMVTIGFGFKVAAAPFHFWAPDVYEAAPAPSAALIASGSKVASFVVFYRVMSLGFAGVAGRGDWRGFVQGWVPVIAVVAVLSMVLGNLVAIRQTSVRRLLAYSAIAHAGYILLAFLAHTEQSFEAMLYYVFTYGLTTVGLFGAVAVVEQQTGGDSLKNFAGLSRRAPVLSFCIFIFVLSLAGIPPLAGFFGKFYVFTSMLAAEPRSMGLLWLVVLAIAMSAVSLYYYLQVLKRVYIADPPAGAEPVRTPMVTQVILCLLAAAVVLLGSMPNILLQWLAAVVR